MQNMVYCSTVSMTIYPGWSRICYSAAERRFRVEPWQFPPVKRIQLISVLRIFCEREQRTALHSLKTCWSDALHKLCTIPATFQSVSELLWISQPGLESLSEEKVDDKAAGSTAPLFGAAFSGRVVFFFPWERETKEKIIKLYHCSWRHMG